MADKIITNTMQHPLPLAVWCVTDNYDYNDDPYTISTTTLLKPIRQIVLAKQNEGNLKTLDVDNLIAVSMGSAIHDSVENAWKNKDKAVEAMTKLGIDKETATKIYNNTSFETRLTKSVGKWTITGKYDIVTDGQVCDIKSSSVYGYLFGSSDWQYRMQMSIYRWLNPELITNDIGVNLYIFTDWSKLKALQDRSYPQSRIQTKQHILEDYRFIDQYISNKLNEIDKYMSCTNQDDIPECTDTELWKDKDTYAYYKNPNSTRSTKNYDNLGEATDHLIKDGNTGKIEIREGKAKACAYCAVSTVCNQYKRLQLAGRI